MSPFQHHFEQHLTSSSLPVHQQTSTVTERRRRRRNIEEGGRRTTTHNNGAVLFFDISGFGGERAVLVESAKLVVELRKGSGRVALLQRVPGGSGITLDSLLVEEEGGEVEMEVRREFHQNDSFNFISIEMWMILHFCCRCDMQSKAGSWIQG